MQGNNMNLTAHKDTNKSAEGTSTQTFINIIN